MSLQKQTQNIIGIIAAIIISGVFSFEGLRS